MTHYSTSLTVLVLALLIVSCVRQENEADSTNDLASNEAATVTDNWLGQWNGPEGTVLRLTGGGGKYQIIIQNLDGARTFPGTTIVDQIHFQRDGMQESIRATNGAATGMKWLQDKSTCLTIRSGEGYCRE